MHRPHGIESRAPSSSRRHPAGSCCFSSGQGDPGRLETIQQTGGNWMGMSSFTFREGKVKRSPVEKWAEGVGTEQTLEGREFS